MMCKNAMSSDDEFTNSLAQRKNSPQHVALFHDDWLRSPEDSDSHSEETDYQQQDPTPVILPDILAELDRCILAFGPDALPVAEAWNSLGLVRCRIQKNYPAAIRCHRQALRIFSLHANNNDQSAATCVVVTLLDLGSAYELAQKNDAALDIFRKAHAMIIKAPKGSIPCRIASLCKRSIDRTQMI